MSEKSREDLLDEIMGRDPAYSGKAAQDAPTPEVPPSPGGDGAAPEAAPAPERKNRRSAVYIYLLILFGAAFLMLLLAYFVQQRSNETTISDLRDSINLSRKDLMAQIADLEERNGLLSEDVLAQKNKVLEAEDQIYKLTLELDQEKRVPSLYYYEKRFAETLAWLERFRAEKDWLMAAVVVQEQDRWFNGKHPYYGIINLGTEADPIQTARWLELRREVSEQLDCLVMEASIPEGGEYTERPYLTASGQYDEGTLDTALHLWWIFDGYAQGPEKAEVELISFYLYGGSLNSLREGPFQPSTVALLEQIIGDLANQGVLETHDDGTVDFLIGNNQSITFELDSGELIQSDLTMVELQNSYAHISAIPDVDVSRETTGD